MTHLMYCSRCRAEGRKTEPPYDPKHHEVPMRWRESTRCFMCNGRGYRPATDAEVRAHKAAALHDYPRGDLAA